MDKMGRINTKKGVKKESENAIELTYRNNERLQEKKRCFFCQYSFFIKDTLRIVLREYPIFMTLIMVQMCILEGCVISHKKHTISYLKMNQDQAGYYPTQDDLAVHWHDYRTRQSGNRADEDSANATIFGRIRRFFGRLFNRIRRNAGNERSSRNRNQNENRTTINTFLIRLAENLDIQYRRLEDCIDEVMTTENEILLELNLRKLTRISTKSEDAIKCKIINMCWTSNWPTSEIRYRHDNGRNYTQNDNDWFEMVDRGCVVPFQSNFYGFTFHNSLGNQSLKNLLDKCIHEIEEHSSNTFSWYTDDYLYHDLSYPCDSFSYKEYLEYQKTNKIYNPKVIVVESNPLELGTHFAHVISTNFYSHHKYIRDYLREVRLYPNSIIRINKEIPFVIRSLNPVTRTHMFHIVYKRNFYNRPTYENVYKGLVLLRDVMNRMKLKQLAMSKIGCFSERLNFIQIIRMTEFIFLNTDINIQIGLNLDQCYQFRRSHRTVRYDLDECLDNQLERLNQFFPCESEQRTSRTDVYSSDED